EGAVRAGLEGWAGRHPDIVLVHDAARPFASAALIRRAIDDMGDSQAAVPALPVSDTVKQIDAAGRVTDTLDRSCLVTVQTPQAFAFRPLLDAHRRAAAAGRDDFTDDAALAEWAGMAATTLSRPRAHRNTPAPSDFPR